MFLYFCNMRKSVLPKQQESVRNLEVLARTHFTCIRLNVKEHEHRLASHTMMQLSNFSALLFNTISWSTNAKILVIFSYI